jgi:hypothetical protein
LPAPTGHGARAAVGLAALGTALTAAGVAAAAQPPPPPILPGVPAVDQYRENIPTGLGPVAPGAASRRGRPLARPAQAALAREAPRVRTELTRIATSPAYGAPPARPRPRAAQKPKPSAPTAKPKPPVAAAAPRSTGFHGGYLPLARLAGLIAVLLALTAATAVAAHRQRRAA